MWEASNPGTLFLSDFTTTGDGLIAALQVLAVIAAGGKPASEVCHLFDPVPQLLKNVRFKSGKPLEEPLVQEAIREGEARLGVCGRVLIRKSGTEPVIRVMAEGDDAQLVNAVVGDIVTSLEQGLRVGRKRATPRTVFDDQMADCCPIRVTA